MKETERNTIVIVILSLVMIILTVLNNGEREEFYKFYPPIKNKTITTQISETLFVDEINEGPMDFERAQSYCKSKGMKLPTKEQAWLMWLASSNCKIAKVTNRHIIKDKQTFINSCHELNTECLAPANDVKYFCNPNADLLFLDEKYFRHGNYWLADRYDKNGHYTANFINGMTNAYLDTIKLLGVRCVKEKK